MRQFTFYESLTFCAILCCYIKMNTVLRGEFHSVIDDVSPE